MSWGRSGWKELDRIREIWIQVKIILYSEGSEEIYWNVRANLKKRYMSSDHLVKSVWPLFRDWITKKRRFWLTYSFPKSLLYFDSSKNIVLFRKLFYVDYLPNHLQEFILMKLSLKCCCKFLWHTKILDLGESQL